MRSPVALILGASVVSGATGYIVTAAVARALGADGYAGFAAFWSALFLVVGALGGIQQEVTRASSPAIEKNSGGSPLAQFTAASALLVFVLLSAIALPAALVILPASPIAAALCFAGGAAGYTLVAVLCGALYGLRAWKFLAVLIALDGIIRLAAVAAVLLIWPALELLFVAVALPFPLAVALVLPFVGRRYRGALALDAGTRALSWNVVRTVLAGVGTAAMVSGLPLIIVATSGDIRSAALGPLVLALTLLRAPIVIPLMALQSFLVVRFGELGTRQLRPVLTLGAVVLGGSVALAVLVWWLGPGSLVLFFGPEFLLDGQMLFWLVLSSGLLACMCVTGPALLALGRHSALTVGWIAAAFVTVAIMLLSFPLEVRLISALVVGPVVGLMIHFLILIRQWEPRRTS